MSGQRTYVINGRALTASDAAPHLSDALAQACTQRDRARRKAVGLEQQLAFLEALITSWATGDDGPDHRHEVTQAAAAIRTALNPDADA